MEETVINESYFSRPIPPAPPLQSQPQLSGCKIVIASGKVDEGYCIVGDELIPFGKGFYRLPGTEIVIDEMSANLFRYPGMKAFVAVKKSGGFFSQKTYALQPLRKIDYDKYTKGQLTSQEIQRKFEPPISGYQGAYGKVEIYPTHGIALKMSKTETKGSELTADIVKEIGIYRLLSEIACLPRMYRFSPGKSMEIQLEKGTPLDELLIQDLTLESKQSIMFRAVKCLRTIASQGIIHADIKPSNMVLSSDGQVLIIDWGLVQIDHSKNQQRLKNAFIQSLWWRAPEILKVYQKPPLRTNSWVNYSHKIDIFSLGLIFCELYARYYGITSSNDNISQKRTLLCTLLNWQQEYLIDEKYVNNIFNGVVNGGSISDKIKRQLLTNPKFTPDDGQYKQKPMPENLADLISRMLEFNPDYRIDYDEMIIHPFFQYMHREAIPRLPIFINNMPKITEKWATQTVKMRKAIFKWLAEVAILMKYGYDCLCLSWQLIDLYILAKQQEDFTLSKLSTCACASMMLAAKIYEISPYDMNEFIRISNGSTNANLLTTMELEIMEITNGNIIIPSLYTYYSHYKGMVSASKADLPSFTKALLNAYLADDIYARPFSESWKNL